MTPWFSMLSENCWILGFLSIKTCFCCHNVFSILYMFLEINSLFHSMSFLFLLIWVESRFCICFHALVGAHGFILGWVLFLYSILHFYTFFCSCHCPWYIWHCYGLIVQFIHSFLYALPFVCVWFSFFIFWQKREELV